jgi:hypothetical protein
LIDKTAGSKTIMPSFPAFNILTVCSSEKVVSEESVIRRVNASFFMPALYTKLIK